MRKLSWLKVAVLIVVAVAIVLAVKYGLNKYKVKTTDSNSYYAVFLTNSQVYFGHLSNVNNRYLSLKNIYYLQVAKPLQATAGETIENPTAGETQSKLTLIKLGKEIHGPKDEMKINRHNVLFYEELKDDSKVVQTIKNTK